MSDEALFCRCGGEVGLVRLTPSLLVLAHKVNPKDRHHYVRLARSATASPLGRADGSPSEGLDTHRAKVASTSPSPSTGAPSGAARARVSKPVEPFDPRVDASGGPDACWPWTGLRSPKGYGRYRNGRAHRFAWVAANGPVPDGLVLDHLCRNRACCNPAHLEPVTNRENIVRGEGITAKLARSTHCKRGHDFTGRDKRGRRWCRQCIPLRPSRAANSLQPRAERASQSAPLLAPRVPPGAGRR